MVQIAVGLVDDPAGSIEAAGVGHSSDPDDGPCTTSPYVYEQMARKNSAELAVIPLIVVGLGALFAVMYAANVGPIAFIVVGAIALAAVVVLAVVLARRANRRDSFEASSPPADGIHRVLIVTDGPYTVRDVHELSPASFEAPTSVFVVAPAMSSGLDRLTGDEDAYAQAGQDLGATIDAFQRLGVDAGGRVGAHDPIQAADETLREFPADEIVFVLGETRGATWREHGIVDTARSRYPMPVYETNGSKA